MLPEVTDQPAEVTDLPEAAAPDALALLKTRLLEGVSASPLAVAILGWLCDVDTDPYLVVIRLHGSQVVLRVSGEKITEPFGPLAEFLAQIGVLCGALHLTEDQAQEAMDAARRRLRPS